MLTRTTCTQTMRVRHMRQKQSSEWNRQGLCMKDWGVTQVSEGPKGVLHGTAKVGKQLLWAPEFVAGQGTELLRQLAWRIVHGHSSYYLTLTVSRKFSLVRLALNGFVILEKHPGLFSQACPSSAA